MTEPLAVGLVGAGPWAKMVHAPMLAAGPETRLAGVWARRPEAAHELALKFHARAFERYEEMLDACEAVAFAVAPDAQPALAIEAAQRGKALLLEKPIAAELDGARRLAEAADGVPTMLMLSYRYTAGVRDFLAKAARFDASGGRVTFISGGLMAGPFAFGWRLERGALLDLGPHVIDLASAALGPVTRVRAHGDPLRWVGMLLDHESGARSEASLSGTVGLNPAKVECELFGNGGTLYVDVMAAMDASAFATIRHEFAQTAHGQHHPLDVAHGFYLQELIAAAEADLAR
jgi:predicted dehydrogenase